MGERLGRPLGAVGFFSSLCTGDVFSTFFFFFFFFFCLLLIAMCRRRLRLRLLLLVLVIYLHGSKKCVPSSRCRRFISVILFRIVLLLISLSALHFTYIFFNRASSHVAVGVPYHAVSGAARTLAARKKIHTLLDLCVSSLRRSHANLLCIVPILTDDPPKRDPIMKGKPLRT